MTENPDVLILATQKTQQVMDALDIKLGRFPDFHLQRAQLIFNVVCDAMALRMQLDLGRRNQHPDQTIELWERNGKKTILERAQQAFTKSAPLLFHEGDIQSVIDKAYEVGSATALPELDIAHKTEDIPFGFRR